MFCALPSTTISAVAVTGTAEEALTCVQGKTTESFPCKPEGQIFIGCMATAISGSTAVKFTASVDGCDCSTTSPCEFPSVTVPLAAEGSPDVCKTAVENEENKWKAMVEEVNNNCDVESEKGAAVCAEEKVKQAPVCDEEVKEAETAADATCKASIGEEDAKCAEAKAASESALKTEMEKAVKKAEEQCAENVANAEACTGELFLYQQILFIIMFIDKIS